MVPHILVPCVLPRALEAEIKRGECDKEGRAREQWEGKKEGKKLSERSHTGARGQPQSGVMVVSPMVVPAFPSAPPN